jgi:hypothetical protein
MKKALWLVLPLVILVSGCAAAGYPMRPAPGAYPMRRPMYVQPAPFQAGTLPIGRWDNVMMLALGSTVQALTADGAVATGQVLGASSGSLRIRVASGDVDLPATGVMRVDLLEAPGAGPVRDAAAGAALGATAVGVPGLIVGRMPPARLFAAGGIIGAGHGIEFGRRGSGPVTIYLSPAVASGARAGAQ